MDLSTEGWRLLLLIHAVSTWFLVGLIWVVHTVHYPLFAHVGVPYRPFQEAHMRRISRLLAVPWGVEVLTAAVVALAAPTGTDRSLALAGGVLVVLIVAVTGLWAAPTHGRLVAGFDAVRHRSLLRADLLRTALWSARGLLVALLVWRSYALGAT